MMLGAAPQRVDQESMFLSRLNERVPEFDAMTSRGPRRLADYRGKWLLLFSHPDHQDAALDRLVADLAASHALFQAANCELLFLLYTSRQLRPGLASVVMRRCAAETPFPVVSGRAAQLADRLHILPADGDASRLRVADIIDPQGVLRSRTYYPLSVSCSADRLLYQVRALQAMDEMSGARSDQVSPWYF